MRPKIAVIADDFTGALDCSTPFVLAGLSVVAATRPERVGRALAANADVVVVNTASRALPPGVAADLTGIAAAALGGVDIAFKKIDSRLKGNVLAEVEAAAVAFGRDRIVVAPAIPDQDRPTIAGAVTGRGVPVPLPIAPHVPEHAVIVDATSDADLDELVAAEDWSGTLAVGARGLGLALARRYGDSRPQPFVPSPGTLFAIGSHDPLTLAQLEHLRGAVSWHDATLGAHAGDLASLPALLRSTGPFAGPNVEISERFARAVLAAVDARAPDTLVLSGGDTALAVLDALGIGVVRPLGEAAPGLPWFLIERPARPALRCIVKSGGFGGADTLVNLLPK
ncbi:MAG: four-carbon acid sugar kinase family protein [Devosia sp.]|uniref:four-carbon acid sugar kinase family protein n=1 Tax=Devosia sp. TaxID=1871048 RepID=UPI001AC24714|nr:four-carbon acid sugar kinase family protein [Devosia sp.]MBN9315433.1 four-carbon acid sugar kinase family protein [Devosia sp.]